MTRPNLELLMERVGAQPSEAGFVYDRMVAAVKVDEAFCAFDEDLAAVDAGICRTLGLFCDRTVAPPCPSR